MKIPVTVMFPHQQLFRSPSAVRANLIYSKGNIWMYSTEELILLNQVAQQRSHSESKHPSQLPDVHPLDVSVALVPNWHLAA